MDLEMIRQEINLVDQEIVALLERRMSLVSQVTAYKKSTGKAVLDKNREEEVLNQVAALVQQADYKETIRATFHDIMAQSRAYQHNTLER